MSKSSRKGGRGSVAAIVMPYRDPPVNKRPDHDRDRKSAKPKSRFKKRRS